jgi:uncharacterized protein (TIGR02145 family)
MKTKKILWTLASLIIILIVIVPLTNCEPEGEEKPAVRTVGFSSVSDTSASCTGEVTAIGSGDITARGICYGLTDNVGLSGPHTTTGGGIGEFSSTLNGLEPETRYYFKAYATNSYGTSYGSGMTFVTGSSSGIIPSVTTALVTNITDSSVTCGGEVTDEGSSPVSLRGVFYSTDSIPSPADPITYDGSGMGVFTSNLTGLQPNTRYYIMAYATNNSGTGFGVIRTFKTDTLPGSAPTVITAGVSSITDSSAICGGNITLEGSSPVVQRGICWSTVTYPTLSYPHTSNGAGSGTFTSNITGLFPGTTYYVRAYAINGSGTSYGNEVSFTTSGSNNFTDPRDGKEYPVIPIGSQVWLGKNMSYATGNSWCFNNVQANCDTYGLLYDWDAAHNACPSGWRLPTKDEFDGLIAYLGADAGGKLKEAGTVHWTAPNFGATNETGFTALPSGFVNNAGVFYSLHLVTGFWSSTEYDQGPLHAWYLYLVTEDAIAYMFWNYKAMGFSVRCIQD